MNKVFVVNCGSSSLKWSVVENEVIASGTVGRIGQPDEIAQLIGYLVGDQASFITGSMHRIDGGELIPSG